MSSTSYAVAVRETWRHYDLGRAASDHRVLVRYATLAASSHNTQPWRFRLGRGSVDIFPDPSRRCPRVDPDDHHLYASLGCAAENLLQAANAAGLQGGCSYDVSSNALRIELARTVARRSALFDAIPLRQCSRVEYDGSALLPEQARLLEAAAQGDGVSLLLLTAPKQKEQTCTSRTPVVRWRAAGQLGCLTARPTR